MYFGRAAVCVARTPRTNVARSCFHPPKSSNYGVFSYDLHLEFLPLRSHYSPQWELARPSCFKVECCQALLDCIYRCINHLIDIFEKYLDSRSCEILAYHTYSWEPKKGWKMKLELHREISRSGGKVLLIILIKLWVFSAPNLLYDIMLILFVYCLEALDREDADTFLTQKPLPRLPSTTPNSRPLSIYRLTNHRFLSCTYANYQFFHSYTYHQHSHFYNPTPTLLKDNSEQLLMALRHNIHQIG